MNTPSKHLLPFTDIDIVVPMLSNISVFGGLNDKQLYRLFRELKQASYLPGEKVFKQGQQASNIYIIYSGKIKIVAEVKNTQMELVELTTGQCFGEISCIGILPHTATAHVIEPTDLLALTSEALITFYEHDKDLFCLLILNIAREACRRLGATQEISLAYALNK